MKQKIQEVIVVEGKSDLNRLKSLFDVDVITTNGSDCQLETINLIKQISANRKIILFLDPDYAGEKIRKKIMQFIPEAKHCFLTKQDMKPNAKKIGLAEAKTEAILLALKNVVSFNQNLQTLSQQEFNCLPICNKIDRLNLCEKLNISYCNNKQLFKRLNFLGLTFNQVKQIIKNENSK